MTANADHPNGSKSLLFLHIPKTAGTSLVSLLSNRFSAERVLLTADRGAGVHRDPDDFDLVTGHLGFDYVRRCGLPRVTFVVLREPIARALSAFYFHRSQLPVIDYWLQQDLPAGLREQYEEFRTLPPDVSLEEFMSRHSRLARTWLGNAQTRQLQGPPFVADDATVSTYSYAQAAANLASCDVVGVTERLDDSLRVLAARMHWPECGPVPRHNETSGRPHAEAISAAALHILRDWNDDDLRLYSAAVRLLDERLQSLGPEVNPTRTPRQPRRLPLSREFAFSEPIVGQGWYSRERLGDHWFCWMGRRASLVLDLEPSGPVSLRCRIVHALSPESALGLVLSVNGHPLPTQVTRDGDGWFAEAVAPDTVVASCAGRLEIQFYTPTTICPSAIAPGNPDGRALGVAISGVGLLVLPRAAA